MTFVFRLLRRYLALWPTEVGGVHRLLEIVSEGGPGHGPIHRLSASAAEIGLRWDPLGPVLVCLCLATWLALCSISKLLFLMLGVIRLLPIFVVGKVFGVGLCLMFTAPCSSLLLLMFEKEIRLCKGVSWLGGVWKYSLLGGVRGQPVPSRFCGAPDGDGHLLWECTFPPLVEIRENPEFLGLIGMDKAHWPRCLLWHGWLPILS